jgi:DNA ligase-1
MNFIEDLPELYKRDSKGKVRVWSIEVGYSNDDYAGTRTLAGIKDGKIVISEWNLSEAKNVGKINSTNAYTQAQAEAKALWDKRIEKEYFINISEIDSYDKFEPMLAGDYTKVKVKPTSGYCQPKLDGIRCIANSKGLWTRSGKPITSCPHIWDEIKDVVALNPAITLDGELYNHDLKEDFNKIVSLVRKTKLSDQGIEESKRLVQYHVYDVYDSNEPDSTFFLRSERLKMESTRPRFFDKYLHLVPTTFYKDQDELDELYSAYTSDGYEGQMVRLDEKYENKRSKYLLKRKEFITEEFEVVSMEEGQGNWSGHTKRFILRLADGREVGAGVRGNQDQLGKLWESQETPTWATLRYFDLTPDGIPRFPVVIDYGVGERDD